MNKTYNLNECDATLTASKQSDALTADPHLFTEAVGLDVCPAALEYSFQPPTPVDCATISPIDVKSSVSELESKQRQDAEQPLCSWSRRKKKRFNAAMGRGLSRTEAIRFAMTPITQTKTKQKPKTKAQTEPAKQQGSKVASSVKLGFISADRMKPLTAEHMAKLKAAILRAILLCPAPVVGPGFERCVPRDEWLLLECEENNTAEWVRSTFGQIKALCSLDVELMEEDEFPRAQLIRGIFPDSSETPCDTILEYLNCQNMICTNRWRVAQRTEQGATTHLAILVDTKSYRTLTAWNGIVNYCYGKIKLVLKNKVAKGVTAGTVSVPFMPDMPTAGTEAGNKVKPSTKATKAKPKRVRSKGGGKAKAAVLQSRDREGNERI